MPPVVVPITGDWYESLFREHFPAVVRLAALMGADDPEDVAQEAFVRLHRSGSRLRDQEAALAYLRRTVVNLSRSRLRHLKVVRRRAPEQWVAPSESAEDVGAARQQHRDVVAALDRLPDRQRAVLVLRFWSDLAPEQVAQTLGIAVGTVKSATSRGVAALARELGEQS
jgi:RNA polymerase sigma-70 factor (sigma-E family)